MEELGPDREQQTVYQTQHFEVVVFDEKEGEAALYRRDTHDLVMGRIVPAEYAGLIAEVAEHGYHKGVDDTLKRISRDMDTLPRELCGPINWPKPIRRPVRK